MASIYEWLTFLPLPIKKLINACEDNNIEKVRRLLKYRFLYPVNGRGYFGTPLTRSISPEMIKLLLTNGAKVNKIIRDQENKLGHNIIYEETALCSFNAIHGKYEIIKCLLENGADPNILLTNNNIEEQTPLFLIIGNSDLYDEELLIKLELLIKHGANINKQDDNGDTPLMTFLKDIENPLNKNAFYKNAFILQEKYSIAIINLLIKNDANLNLQNKLGQNALSIAKEKHNKDIEKILIKEGSIVKDIKTIDLNVTNITKPMKKIKKSQLQCEKCFEIYNFRTFASMMTDEKMFSSLPNSTNVIAINYTTPKPDLVNKKYTFIGKVIRFIGYDKGVPKHVKNCFRKGISRKWICERCHKVNEYPYAFIKYWS